MTSSSNETVLRITCKSARDVWVGNSRRTGLLITTADINLLRVLSSRDITVCLVCPGHKSYTAPVRALLQRVRRVPTQDGWYIPTSLTGPLRETLPALPGTAV